MRKLLICAVLLMSGKTTMADAVVISWLAKDQSGDIDVNGQQLENKVETKVNPGDALVLGSLYFNRGKIKILKACHVRTQLRNKVLYHVSLRDTKDRTRSEGEVNFISF